jgi:hypothetical protein
VTTITRDDDPPSEHRIVSRRLSDSLSSPTWVGLVTQLRIVAQEFSLLGSRCAAQDRVAMREAAEKAP